MATSKATTTSDLSGADLKTDADAAPSNTDVKEASATLPSGTKVTGPKNVIDRIKK